KEILHHHHKYNKMEAQSLIRSDFIFSIYHKILIWVVAHRLHDLTTLYFHFPPQKNYIIKNHKMAAREGTTKGNSHAYTIAIPKLLNHQEQYRSLVIWLCTTILLMTGFEILNLLAITVVGKYLAEIGSSWFRGLFFVATEITTDSLLTLIGYKWFNTIEMALDGDCKKIIPEHLKTYFIIYMAHTSSPDS
ncbi:hypothetical protein ACJX0J_010011, partial [Zea mays]